MTDGRGAVLPKLGTFVLLHSGSGGMPDGGPSTPSLQLSRELSRGHVFARVYMTGHVFLGVSIFCFGEGFASPRIAIWRGGSMVGPRRP